MQVELNLKVATAAVVAVRRGPKEIWLLKTILPQNIAVMSLGLINAIYKYINIYNRTARTADLLCIYR